MIVIAGLLGLFIGSFLNVLVDRIPRGESVLFGRSHCESCKKILQWYDLFPVISFLLLKGKCRYCHNKLSSYYPFVEILTGLLFAFTTYYILPTDLSSLHPRYVIELVYYVYLVSVLIVVFFTDLKYGIIPFVVVLPAILISSFATIMLYPHIIFSTIYSAIGASFLFLFLFLGTKGRGMGFGDVVFALFMGIVLGLPRIVLAIYLAFLTGAIVSLILISWGKKKLAGGTIPFGPFLVFSTYISIFWGDFLVQLIRQVLNI